VRAYRLAYDGRPYHGFQRQPDVRTVEDALLAALAALGVSDGVPPGYAAAGRTDAGVSALAQTVAFEAPEWLSPAAVNSELPDAVRVWASADAPEGFHATHSATGREYTYFLYAADADPERARDALERLSGEHDFHNLTPDERGTVRTLEATLEPDDPFFALRFRAGGFPRQLVRRAVRLVDDVAHGHRDPAFVDRVLSAETLAGPEGVGPASPTPLVLTAVSYPDIQFIAGQETVGRVRGQFAELHRQRAARARVAEALTGLEEP